jgi:hypothetical protein
LKNSDQKTVTIEFILVTDKGHTFIEQKDFPDVPMTGLALLNLEHICKSFLHNSYLVKHEPKLGAGLGFSYFKHNIVKVYCRISDESLPQTSPETPEDPSF